MNEILNPLKCINCQKIFKTMQAYDRHKNRKTPCLIRDIPSDQLMNPNRCIYCNKILANKNNLKRHLLEACKIKNGGGDILVGKVADEQLIEQMQRMRQTIDNMANKIQQLESRGPTHQTTNINNIGKSIDKSIDKSKSINNSFNTINSNNVQINHYLAPNMDYIRDKFKNIIVREQLDAPNSLIIDIYFDREHPENHSVYLDNIKNKNTLVFNGTRWSHRDHKVLSNEIGNLTYDFVLDELSKIIDVNAMLNFNAVTLANNLKNKRKEVASEKYNKQFYNNLAVGSKSIDKPDYSKTGNKRYDPFVMFTYHLKPRIKLDDTIVIIEYDMVDIEMTERLCESDNWVTKDGEKVSIINRQAFVEHVSDPKKMTNILNNKHYLLSELTVDKVDCEVGSQIK